MFRGQAEIKLLLEVGALVPYCIFMFPNEFDCQSFQCPSIFGRRHNKTLGLIAAKKTGGNAALGDVVVFFDCHVKPRDGWEEAEEQWAIGQVLQD